MAPFIETDCTIVHNGKGFTAGGAFISESHIVAYPDKGGVLKDWHGRILGTWHATKSWLTYSPYGYQGPRMYSIRARLSDGRTYVGRGQGEGMVFKGKRAASDLFTRKAAL